MIAGLLFPNIAKAKEFTVLCEGFIEKLKVKQRQLRTINTDKKEVTFWWHETNGERVELNTNEPLLDITPTRYVLSRYSSHGTIYLDRVTGMREYSKCPECKIPCKEVPHPKMKF